MATPPTLPTVVQPMLLVHESTVGEGEIRSDFSSGNLFFFSSHILELHKDVSFPLQSQQSRESLKPPETYNL